MENAKHTPGPWDTGEDGWIVESAKGWAVSHAVVFRGKHGEGEDFANARLIAAAPDLLAALEELTRTAASLVDYHDDPETEAAIDVARAAIAKAKGEA